MSEKLLIERLKAQAEDVYGPVREVILDAAMALIDYETLKRAVNESTNECGPDCDEHHHGDNCPSLNSAQWLIDQQYALDSRDRTIRELTDELLKADNKLAAAESKHGNATLREMLLEKTAKLAEAERDAARYRWLVNCDEGAVWAFLCGMDDDQIDDAIDKWIADESAGRARGEP